MLRLRPAALGSFLIAAATGLLGPAAAPAVVAGPQERAARAPAVPGPAAQPMARQEAAAQDDRQAALRAELERIQQELIALQQAARATQDLSGETSVKPGINDSWKSDNIRPLIQRLEAESREIFTEAHTLAAVAGPRPGAHIADVGAGSGFMSQLFAQMVGAQGRVYAVDINATMMQRLSTAAQQAGLNNLQTVVCDEKDVRLPEASVDMVFVCDTYHHFEYPRNTLRSIHRALRPGGQLVIIDFHRIEGVSRDFVMEHVRAGEEVFTAEILGAGFVLENRHDLPQLTENYCLRFRKI